jgi:hypothetical protein
MATVIERANRCQHRQAGTGKPSVKLLNAGKGAVVVEQVRREAPSIGYNAVTKSLNLGRGCD